MTDYLAPPISTRPRRRIRWRRWVIALAVLLALLIGADRVAVAVADTEAAKTIQTSQHLDSRPSVTIGGFPFLTQLASGTLDNVTATAKNVVAGRDGRTVRIAKVTAHLHRVHISRSVNSARAETADASALISYPDLSQTLGVGLSYAGRGGDGQGRIKATKSVSVAGQQITGEVSAELSVADNVLSFVAPQVSVAGATVPPVVIETLQSAFGAPISLNGLPFGLTVRSVTASRPGVTINLEGTNLTYGGR